MGSLEDKYYLSAMGRLRGIGADELRGLLKAFNSMEEVWGAPIKELIDVGRLAPKVADALAELRRADLDAPQRLAAECAAKGIGVCSLLDDDYPPPLREIHRPPLAFFFRGRLPTTELAVAIVGSRKCSQYGIGIATEIAAKLAEAGVTVVSGAARGIDTASHTGALSKGSTVAVLGCGVDVVYPKENAKLLAEIADKGAIIAEQPPGTKPLPTYFPARNRIIAGLTKGTVVVEAAEKSGSLITADLALGEGRDVFAVPGSIYSPTSRGCHRLIQHGAKLVTSWEDILREYGLETAAPSPQEKTSDPALSGEEALVYNALSYELPMTVDEIVWSLQGSDASNVAFILLQLELKGLVSENEAHAYLRAGRMN